MTNASKTQVVNTAAEWDAIVKNYRYSDHKDERDLATKIDDATFEFTGDQDVKITFGARQMETLRSMIERLDDGTEQPVETTEDAIDALVEVAMQPVCSCGCGEPVAKGRTYKAGHDQRHKGILLQQAAAGNGEAAALLIAKGWRTMEQIARASERLNRPKRAYLGTCAVCGRGLSDPHSVEAGIGPVCADHQEK